MAITVRLLIRRAVNSCVGLRFGFSKVNFEPDRQKQCLRLSAAFSGLRRAQGTGNHRLNGPERTPSQKLSHATAQQRPTIRTTGAKPGERRPPVALEFLRAALFSKPHSHTLQGSCLEQKKRHLIPPPFEPHSTGFPQRTTRMRHSRRLPDSSAVAVFTQELYAVLLKARAHGSNAVRFGKQFPPVLDNRAAQNVSEFLL